MKKQFEDRVRLVVYMERGDLVGITAVARKYGKTVVEWARELLVGELDAEGVQIKASVEVEARAPSQPAERSVPVVEEEPPEEKRRGCTYLWPTNGKKCPRCKEVHEDV